MGSQESVVEVIFHVPEGPEIYFLPVLPDFPSVFVFLKYIYINVIGYNDLVIINIMQHTVY